MFILNFLQVSNTDLPYILNTTSKSHKPNGDLGHWVAVQQNEEVID